MVRAKLVKIGNSRGIRFAKSRHQSTRYEHEGRAMREHDLLVKTCFSSTHALPIPDTFSRLAQQASAD